MKKENTYTLKQKLYIYNCAYSTKSKVTLDDWFTIKDELRNSKALRDQRART